LLWSASGFPAAARTRLESALAPLGTFGTGGAGAPGSAGAPLAAGSAVAGVLVDGDFSLAATGTVTERTGDGLLAFGHPFLGATLPITRLKSSRSSPIR
jgi:hypothetical protein